MTAKQTLIKAADMGAARSTAKQLGDVAIVRVVKQAAVELWVVDPHGGRQLVRDCARGGWLWEELELFGRGDARYAGATA